VRFAERLSPSVPPVQIPRNSTNRFDEWIQRLVPGQRLINPVIVLGGRSFPALSEVEESSDIRKRLEFGL